MENGETSTNEIKPGTKNALIEIILRRIYDQSNEIGSQSSLVSEWQQLCESVVDGQELLNLCLNGNASAEEDDRPSTSKLETVIEAPAFQPIQVVVDENPIEDVDQQPSTSSSVISSLADSQQDAKVYQRVAELRRNGLWSCTRLPMCVEPPRPKLHWDFLLEEIIWMSTDFRQERLIKRRLARKLCSDAKNVWRRKFVPKKIEPFNNVREAKKTCGAIARMIKEFWVNVDKVVDYRAKEIINLQKRKALDQHLNFLVGEADKLSTILHGRLGNTTTEPKSNRRSNRAGEKAPKKLLNGETEDEEDYDEPDSSEDDESTIAREEKSRSSIDHQLEMEELNREADMEIDDLLSSLPADYLEQIGMRNCSSKTSGPSSSHSQGLCDNDSPTEMDIDNESLSKSSNNDRPLEGTSSNTEDSSTKPPNVDSEVRRKELDNIAEAALEFQPKGYTLETTQVKTEVPFLINGSLREYQLVGLDWLVTLYEKNLNGILADEMGLGKTIQTIALLAHLACERTVWGPHLIIVPTSVLLNWEMELKKWCPSFKILTYFGSAKERAEKRKGWTKDNVFHVCITSYKIVTQDIRAFKSKAWQYMILDEAQNIKNFNSQRWRALLNVRSRHRLLLTGTPLQNNLMELWSLLHFLMPNVFVSHEDFKDWFSNPLTNMVEGNIEMDNALVQRLHKVLRPFILRRLKSEVETQLPTKQEKVVQCVLSKRQRFLYNEFLSKKSTIDNLQSGNMMSVLNIVMQLRKCCNHPNLFESRPVVSPLVVSAPNFYVPPQLRCLSKTIRKDVDRIFAQPPSECVQLRAAPYSSKSLWRLFEEISQNVNIELANTKEEILPKIKGIKFAVDRNFNGAGIYLHRVVVNNLPNQNSLDDVENSTLKEKTPLKNNRKRKANLMLEEPINPLNSKRFCHFRSALADIRARQRSENYALGIFLSVNQRMYGAPILAEEVVSIVRKYFSKRTLFCRFDEKNVTKFTSDNNSSTSSFSTNCIFDRACEMISEGITEWVEDAIGQFLLYVKKVLLSDTPFVSTTLQAYDRFNWALCKNFLRSVYSQRSALADRVRLGHQFQFPELRLIEYDCGKLQTLSKLLIQLYENKHRCLIFTQMSKMLDILQAFLSYHNYKYFRLDGTTKIEQRQGMMERFNTDNSIFCFILSTRSGGIGVNLIGADTVIFYDSDWNPTMDAQAQDRCHRIGQTRNVTIYRLISENTIEENILKRANQKRRLGEMTIDEAEFTPNFFRNSDNIRDLFSNEKSVADIVAPIQVLANNPKEIEMAMATVEDQQDVLAAQNAQAEARMDVADFDENLATNNLPTQSVENLHDIDSPSEQYNELINNMTPIERYAVAFLENEYRPELEEEVKEAEALIEAKKEVFLRNNENSILMDAAEEEAYESGVSINENKVEFTYDTNYVEEDLTNLFGAEACSTWMPPSPPNSEIDASFEIDDDVFFFENELYENELIPEDKLPPVTIFPVVNRYNSPNNARLSHPPKPARRPLSQNSSLNHSELNSTQHRKHIGKLISKKSSRENGLPIPPSTPTIAQKSGGDSTRSRNPSGDLNRSFSENFNSSKKSIPVLPSTEINPSKVLSYQDYDSKSNFQTTSSAYDSAMLSALNNGLSNRSEKKSIDECIESVRRSSFKRQTKYISRSGPPENVHLLVRPDLRFGTETGGFAIPASLEATDYEGPLWTCNEDYDLLNAVTKELKLTSEQIATCSGLIINWDLVANYVNRHSRHYRSSRQCCIRYQNAILRFDDNSNDTFQTLYSKRNRRTSVSSNFDTTTKRHRSSIPSRIYFDANQRIVEGGSTFKGHVQALGEAIAYRKQIHYPLFARQLDNQEESSPQLVSVTGGLPSQQEARFAELGIVNSEMLSPIEILKARQLTRERQQQQQLQTQQQKMEQSRQTQ